jgi:tetratricopeptide (TPR) repeat protein
MSLLSEQKYLLLQQFCDEHLHENNLLGLFKAIALGKLGKYYDSYSLFDQLHIKFPKNPDIVFNKALILREQNDKAGSMLCFIKCLKINPDYHQAHHAIANLKVGEDIFIAIDHYKSALSINYNIAYVRSLANALYSGEFYIECINLIHKNCKSSNEYEDLYLLLIATYKSEQRSLAKATYKRALVFFPNDPEILFLSALIEIDEKRFVLAKTFLIETLDSTKNSQRQFEVRANILLCNLMLNADEYSLHELRLMAQEKLCERDYEFFANLFETKGEFKPCEDVVQRGLSDYPENLVLSLVKAKVLRRKSQLSKAKEILCNLLEKNGAECHAVSYELIKIYEAEHDFTKSAAVIRSVNSVEQRKHSRYFKAPFRIDIDFTENDFSLEGKLTSRITNQYKMIFIVGFPRSGTTLIESRLARFDRVKVLEETSALRDLYVELKSKANGKPVIKYLADLNYNQINEVVEDYIDSINQFVNYNPETDVLVDKMPLNASLLPLIGILFPSADIVVVHRDPRDVYISCLKQEELNIGNLDEFSSAYDKLFCSIQKTRDSSICNIYDVFYEEFVLNFDDVFLKLVNSLSLTADIKTNESDFNLINTPSYYQVVRPIYQESIAIHKHYLTEFSVDNDIITKWLNKNGYTDPIDNP